MTETPNLFPLKLIVVTLGLLLIGGMGFVLTTLVNKANKMNAPCEDVSVSIASLHVKGNLAGISPQGATLQLTFQSPEGNTLLTLDRCSGTVQQKFTITP